jgi:hypothetical protein
MSSRFGRNQRRKLREEIACRDRECERLTAVARGHYDDMIEEVRARGRTEGEMVEWASRIVALLGPTSAFARELVTLGVDAQQFASLASGLPMRVEDPGIESLRPSTAAVVEMAKRVVEVFACYAGHETDHTSFRRRFEVVGPAGRAALVMDERTIHDLKSHGDRELLRYLTRQLLGPWMAGKVPA